jgi:hypothetical protein
MRARPAHTAGSRTLSSRQIKRQREFAARAYWRMTLEKEIYDRARAIVRRE